MFKPKTLENYNNKLSKLFERYYELSDGANMTSIYQLYKLGNNVFKISLLLYDMYDLIKKEYQQYHTGNDEYIKSIKTICNILLNDLKIGKIPKKMSSSYTNGIELIEMLSQSLMDKKDIIKINNNIS